MCTTCGCSGEGEATVTRVGVDATTATARHGHGHDHVHRHDSGGDGGDAHARAHAEAHAHATATVELERDLLAHNDRIAMHNRGWLEGRNTLALNLVSSPGAGKTTLLARTVRALAGAPPVSVVEGDQETHLDAERIRAAGAATVQVNTGTGCHLDAGMLRRALDELAPPPDSVVLIENVGNLVCPALFDLGEAAKVVILSVTEGDDKPLKYPHMFRAAGLLLVNKLDLLPHVDFDVAGCVANARRVNPGIEVLTLSARTGEGFDAWLGWLRARVKTA